MRPKKYNVYEMLREFDDFLRGRPVKVFPNTASDTVCYRYLINMGFIEVAESNFITNHRTGEMYSVPEPPLKRITKEGYQFMEHYDTRWPRWIHYGITFGCSAVGLVGGILGIITFFTR